MTASFVVPVADIGKSGSPAEDKKDRVHFFHEIPKMKELGPETFFSLSINQYANIKVFEPYFPYF